mmetsp:Transcript_4245/g.11784  ORF Transcript_4245/g.11784 Transcript_4245/m.11784 type:complete len:123 (+) Transcript_4245:1511-1879(+)
MLQASLPPPCGSEILSLALPPSVQQLLSPNVATPFSWKCIAQVEPIHACKLKQHFFRLRESGTRIHFELGDLNQTASLHKLSGVNFAKPSQWSKFSLFPASDLKVHCISDMFKAGKDRIFII